MEDAGNPVSGAFCEKIITIKNAQGLHARPAAQFVRIASKFPEADLTVEKDSLSVNGKSIIGIMMLAAGPGSQLSLKAQGNGAEQLLDELEQLVESLFGEESAT